MWFGKLGPSWNFSPTDISAYKSRLVIWSTKEHYHQARTTTQTDKTRQSSSIDCTIPAIMLRIKNQYPALLLEIKVTALNTGPASVWISRKAKVNRNCCHLATFAVISIRKHTSLVSGKILTHFGEKNIFLAQFFLELIEKTI